MRIAAAVLAALLASAALAVPAPPAVAQTELTAGDPVHRAVAEGNVEQIRLLVSRGTRLDTRDAQDRTPLMMAALQGRSDIVTALLAGRVNLDARDRAGATPLYRAAEAGHAEIVAALLGRGARVDQDTRDGMTPLMAAARFGHLEAVRALLGAGADPRRADFSGRSALDWAREGRSRAVTDALSAAAR